MGGIETPVNDLEIRMMNPATGSVRSPLHGALPYAGMAALREVANAPQAYVYGDRRRLYAPYSIPAHHRDKRLIVTGWIARAGAGGKEKINWVMTYLGPAPGGQGMSMFEHAPDY